MRDLTGFQRDCMLAIAALDHPHGLGVLTYLEDELGCSSIPHGRIYPNLNELVTHGLVMKTAADGRTNSYWLTPRGEREVVHEAALWADNTQDAGLDIRFPRGQP